MAEGGPRLLLATAPATDPTVCLSYMPMLSSVGEEGGPSNWLKEILTSLFSVVIFLLCIKSEGDSKILYEGGAACVSLAFSEGLEVPWVLFTASVGDVSAALA